MTLVASYKLQAASDKLCEAQAASLRQIVARHYVASYRQQASSFKLQASSFKLQALSRVGSKAFGGKRVRQIVARHYVTKTQGASGKRQALSNKHQAASRELLAL
jgi:hypothetical protein